MISFDASFRELLDENSQLMDKPNYEFLKDMKSVPKNAIDDDSLK